ncbi:MAG: molecular chaperone DnaJ [Candidatus Pacebacteria bacterium]|nr:molecular chaperone DnaJ [Candidatus Paceibacterota bacterium]
MEKDYYKILGVEKSATQDEIKKAYYKLAHEHHPDKKGGNEARFKEVNEAYQTLSDKDKRSQYDQFGSSFNNQGGFGFNQNINWEDVMGGFGGGGIEDLFDIFGGAFGGQKQNKRDLRKGRNVEIGIDLELESILRPQERELRVMKNIRCSRCNGSGAEPGTSVRECVTCRGTGRIQQIKKTFLGTISQYTTCTECAGEGVKPEKPCNVCRGEGRVKGEERIRITIPAGVDNNQIIKVKGKGEAGKRGGEPGDLYIRIFIKPHSVFERRGDDIYLNQSITFSQAALGDKLKIPTLDKENLIIKIPAGLTDGNILKISRGGIPHFSGVSRGNLYIQLSLDIPDRLTKKQKEALEELKKQGL